MNQYPIGLLEHIHDTVLEGLSFIKSKHGLKMKFDAFTERIPTFGGSLGVQGSKVSSQGAGIIWAFITFSQGC